MAGKVEARKIKVQGSSSRYCQDLSGDGGKNKRPREMTSYKENREQTLVLWRDANQDKRLFRTEIESKGESESDGKTK